MTGTGHAVALALAIAVFAAGASHTALASEEAAYRAVRAPLLFEANAGQWPADIRFAARRARHALVVRDRGLEVVLAPVALPGDGADARARSGPVRFAMDLVGADVSAFASAGAPVTTTVSYQRGNHPVRQGVPAYSRLRFQNLYPDTDLELLARQGEIEYRYRLGANAEPETIRKRFRQARRVAVNERGELVITLRGHRRLVHRPPTARLGTAGDGAEVDVRYVVLGRRTVGFALAGRPRGAAVVIDPIIDFGTYLGGSGDEPASSLPFGRPELTVARDRHGRLLVAATTLSLDIPATGGAPGAGTWRDVVVAAIDPTLPAGSPFAYVNYIAGSNMDIAADLAIGPGEAVYLCGTTRSADFPAIDGDWADGGTSIEQGFVAVLDSGGNVRRTRLIRAAQLTRVLACTFAAGTDGLDAGLYVTGLTNPGGAVPADINTDLVSAGAFRPAFDRHSDAFVGKFSEDLDSVHYFTFLGGSADEWATDIDVHRGLATVTGTTASPDFPVTPGAFAGHTLGLSAITTCQSTTTTVPACNETFVTRVSGDGTALAFSTLLGEPRADDGLAVVADDDGAVRVATVRRLAGNQPQATIVNLVDNGTSVDYMRRIGNVGSTVFDLELDQAGRVHFAGRTTEPGLPVGPSLDPDINGGMDALYGRLKPDGFFEYMTYLGGYHYDAGVSLALDGPKCVVIGMETRSDDLSGPLSAAVAAGPQPRHSGGLDILMARHCESP